MDKRRRLLESAKFLFATEGYDKTSIRMIAHHASVNSSMISYYFGGKSGLVQGIFEEFFPVQKIDIDTSDPKQQLESIIRSIILMRKEDSELVDFLHREIISGNTGDDIKPYIEPVWIAIRQILENGKSMGIFHYNSIEAASSYIQALISYPYHINVLDLDHRNRALSDEFINDLIDQVMKGVL